MSSLKQQMDVLTTTFLSMSALVEEMLEEAFRAFLRRDSDLAQAVMDKDDAIDVLDNALDEMCLRLLALSNPVAADLRYVVAVMRMTRELERIADEACNVMEHTMTLCALPLTESNTVMRSFVEHSASMFRNTVDAFRNRDAELAMKTCGMENMADGLYTQVVQTCLEEISMQEPAAQTSLSNIFIARSLERICDLSTNICELTIFAYDGNVIKHKWPSYPDLA